jgi:hypothetical protein
MTMGRRLVAEFIGTFLLVFLAVGAAVFGIAATIGKDDSPLNGNSALAPASGTLAPWPSAWCCWCWLTRSGRSPVRTSPGRDAGFVVSSGPDRRPAPRWRSSGDRRAGCLCLIVVGIAIGPAR